jgi:hypothetical protein
MSNAAADKVKIRIIQLRDRHTVQHCQMLFILLPGVVYLLTFILVFLTIYAFINMHSDILKTVQGGNHANNSEFCQTVLHYTARAVAEKPAWNCPC